LLTQLLVEVEGVEGAIEKAVESETRAVEGKRELRLFAPGEGSWRLGVIALHEDARAKLRPVETQSIQATEYSLDAAWESAKNSSMP